jgi:hypothetical protein
MWLQRLGSVVIEHSAIHAGAAMPNRARTTGEIRMLAL